MFLVLTAFSVAAFPKFETGKEKPVQASRHIVVVNGFMTVSFISLVSVWQFFGLQPFELYCWFLGQRDWWEHEELVWSLRGGRGWGGWWWRKQWQQQQWQHTQHWVWWLPVSAPHQRWRQVWHVFVAFNAGEQLGQRTVRSQHLLNSLGITCNIQLLCSRNNVWSVYKQDSTNNTEFTL